MSTPTSPSHGAPLIDAVVEHLRDTPTSLRDFCGWNVLTEAQPLDPAVLSTLTFPSGRPLPPSLARWLAFDASWLDEYDWFNDTRTALTPRTLSEIVREEYGYEPLEMGDGTSFDPMDLWTPADQYFPECFLLPDGCDSRRVFAVTQPDRYGEYPVLVTDDDDGAYLAVMYPGIDVYLAERVGVLDLPDRGCYTDLVNHAEYAERMAAHAAHPPFDGAVDGIDMFDLRLPE